ncbi:MAG: carboxypeptidase-like regulatory domain-containing protein [Candidatus Sumerlaeota bacterium]|nr:carboxypeptidase-like regulatory domain-containing protein [Candidatus Sumerlaeota bacterium]
MKSATRRPLVLSSLSVVFSLFCIAASAMVSVHEGNDPVPNMGWPNGAEAVANLPERLGFTDGPRGGEFCFSYRCKNTAQFNEALQKFAAIRLPRTGRGMYTSVTGEDFRLSEDRPLLLVVCDRARKSSGVYSLIDRRKEAEVDWTFTIWMPGSYDQWFNDHAHPSSWDQTNSRRPVPPPQIDVLVGDDGPIRWKDVKVPDNVQIIDLRAESAPMDVKNGGAIRGRVFDMVTYQTIAAATVVLMRPPKKAGDESKETASTRTGDDGRFELSGIPAGYYEVQISAEGYAERMAAYFNNRSGHSLLDFDALINRAASLKGVVVDDKGEPIADVQVGPAEAFGTDGRGYSCAPKPSTTTDAQGVFELADLPEGYVILRCQAPSLHQQTSLFDLYNVSAGPPQTPPEFRRIAPQEIRIVMTGTGVVRGKVIGPDGKPPTRQFIVEMEPKGGSKIGSWGGSMQCQKDGAFEFTGAPPGEYVLIAHPNPMKEGESSEPKAVTVKAGGVEEVTIECQSAR